MDVGSLNCRSVPPLSTRCGQGPAQPTQPSGPQPGEAQAALDRDSPNQLLATVLHLAQGGTPVQWPLSSSMWWAEEG